MVSVNTPVSASTRAGEEQAAHSGRARLPEMAARTFAAHLLAETSATEEGDVGMPENQGKQEGRCPNTQCGRHPFAPLLEKYPDQDSGHASQESSASRRRMKTAQAL